MSDDFQLPKRSIEERYYVSEEEAEQIKRAAYLRGVSKSEYVRGIIIPRAEKDVQRKRKLAA